MSTIFTSVHQGCSVSLTLDFEAESNIKKCLTKQNRWDFTRVYV